MGAFCDYLNVSASYDECATVLDDVLPLLDEVGAERVAGGDILGTWHEPGGGTFKSSRRGKVAVLSASGQFLATLRTLHLFGSYLRALSVIPHRVSLLHATMDVFEDAPPVVDRVYQRALSGGVALTRKAIKREHVKRFWGPGKDGRETGTVYMGARGNADVWAKVYDKRQERLDRKFPDPGPVTRYEVCVHGDAGPTLRDAQDPTAIFYHFASPSLLPRPEGVPAWVSGAEGYVAPPKQEKSAAERLRALVDSSPAFERALKLAAEMGDPSGMSALVSFLSARAIRLARGAVHG